MTDRFKPWKNPEVIQEQGLDTLDDHEQKIAFSRLPLPMSVKERMLSIWINGGKLEDACDPPLSEEEKEKILNSKYIDDTLCNIQELQEEGEEKKE